MSDDQVTDVEEGTTTEGNPEAETEGNPEAEVATPETTTEPDSPPKSGKGGVGKAIGGLVVLGLLYLVAWPIVPAVSAEYIENPMGENFAVASVEQSLVGMLMRPALSRDEMCDTVQAWAAAMKTTAECTDEVEYSRGTITEDGEEPSEFLWSEMADVSHDDETESFCFVSRDGGRHWELGSGLAIMGIFPIQTASGNCKDLRGAKYDLTEDAEIDEDSWTP